MNRWTSTTSRAWTIAVAALGHALLALQLAHHDWQWIGPTLTAAALVVNSAQHKADKPAAPVVVPRPGYGESMPLVVPTLVGQGAARDLRQEIPGAVVVADEDKIHE